MSVFPERIAAVVVRDGRLLGVRQGGSAPWFVEAFVSPEESHAEALRRELQEFSVQLVSMSPYASLSLLDEATRKRLTLQCYLADFEGELRPSGAMNVAWCHPDEFHHQVRSHLIPRLQKDGLL